MEGDDVPNDSRYGANDRFERSSRSRGAADTLVVWAAIATACAGLWLLSVSVLVLPQRDPRGIPFWTIVALSFLAYAGLTALSLRSGRRSGLTRAVAAAASVGAIGLGLSFVATAVARTTDFEGYILLLGLILAGHGSVVLIRELARARPRRTSVE
jgi:hypothetical protein